MIRTAKKAKKSTKVYKLAEVEGRRDYQRQINTMIIDLENRDSDYNLEQMWGCYKGILHKAAESVCGTVTTGGRKKKTHWWNKKTQEAVKKKKDAWKKYHQLGTIESYEEYKTCRSIAKITIKKEKAKEWEEFVEKMEENRKSNQKLFYANLKRLRQEENKSVSQIINKEGQILNNPTEILDRWKEYFTELLEGTENNQEASNYDGTTVSEPKAEITENDIHIDEVTSAIKSLKNGKAAGIDMIKPEMIKYIYGQNWH
ncbi:uncharacterized protein LOC135125709 [Zophobas morio]|uniref:uncharacterized protein LOC135125709 n=1 Tax=Zophobas morio TaxID=2755281 RepID=UPI003082F8F4